MSEEFHITEISEILQCLISKQRSINSSKIISRPDIFSATSGWDLTAEETKCQLCKPRSGVRSLVVWVAEIRRTWSDDPAEAPPKWGPPLGGNVQQGDSRILELLSSRAKLHGEPLGKCDHLLVWSCYQLSVIIFTRNFFCENNFYPLPFKNLCNSERIISQHYRTPVWMIENAIEVSDSKRKSSVQTLININPYHINKTGLRLDFKKFQSKIVTNSYCGSEQTKWFICYLLSVIYIVNYSWYLLKKNKHW